MEEPDEEWNTKKHNPEAIGAKVSWMLNRGLRLGKQILVAGFVASSAPVVIPPLVVVSAIGLAVSVPYGLFLASHACTEKLMGKLLPRSSPPPFFWGPFAERGEKVVGQHQKVMSFKGDIDIDKEEKELPEETKREIEMRMEMDDVENLKEEENNMTLENDHGQVVKKDEPEISQDARDVIENYDSKGDNGDYIREDEKALAGKPTNREAEVEELWAGENKREEPLIKGEGIVITLDKIGDDMEEFKTPFEITDVTAEELGDHVIEGDIEEAELKKETEELLEKIRDEGEIDIRWKCVKEIQADANEREQSPIENVEVAGEVKHGSTTIQIEREVRQQGYPKVSEEILESRHTENMDPVETEAESDKPIRGMLEEKYVDDRKDPGRQMEEPSGRLNEGIIINESILTEPVGFSLEGRQDYDTLVAEAPGEVTTEKTDSHLNVSSLDNRLGNDIPEYVNQDFKFLGYVEILKSPDADAREIADESGLDLFDEKCVDPQEYSCTVDLYEESNAMANDHIDPMVLPVLSLEHKHRQSEYSSRSDILTSSSEVILREEKIWKQIHAMRMIVGYEGTPQASCIDELKALFIFTGVEPPTFVTNSLAEINDKLHFLMSIVGVKSNMA